MSEIRGAFVQVFLISLFLAPQLCCLSKFCPQLLFRLNSIILVGLKPRIVLAGFALTWGGFDRVFAASMAWARVRKEPSLPFPFRNPSRLSPSSPPSPPEPVCSATARALVRRRRHQHLSPNPLSPIAILRHGDLKRAARSSKGIQSR